MSRFAKAALGVIIFGISLAAAAQCPPRPTAGTVVQDALSLYSQNGVLNAGLNMGYSVDTFGYTHYCYKYDTGSGIVEAPTLRLNPGDQLVLGVKDSIPVPGAESMSSMDMTSSGTQCGDGGTATLQSTNVHFHGMNVPPICHQDDVLTTLIQPGAPAFQYSIQVPTTEPPGLYWYHPHVHGFTEFQVNGGAAGALVVEGMEKYRPEVAGLKERVFVIRQQYLVPWVPGPYELTINFQTTPALGAPGAPIIQVNAGEREFWRVANASLQDFMPLQVTIDGMAQPLELVALGRISLGRAANRDNDSDSARGTGGIYRPRIFRQSVSAIRHAGLLDRADRQSRCGAVAGQHSGSFQWQREGFGKAEDGCSKRECEWSEVCRIERCRCDYKPEALFLGGIRRNQWADPVLYHGGWAEAAGVQPDGEACHCYPRGSGRRLDDREPRA